MSDLCWDSLNGYSIVDFEWYLAVMKMIEQSIVQSFSLQLKYGTNLMKYFNVLLNCIFSFFVCCDIEKEIFNEPSWRKAGSSFLSHINATF